MAVRADPPRSARFDVRRRGKNAVAEVRLGARTQADGRARRSERSQLGAIDMRCVDQAPACIDRRMVEQPLQRPLAAPRNAVVDFALLFGDMNVNRRVGIDRPQSAQQFVQRIGGHRAQ